MPVKSRWKKAFNAYVKRLRYPQKVIYCGVVSGKKKLELMDSFDVFLHTSRHEGMPGAVLEAMARAVPCLVTPGTNMQHIISESGGGWVCDCSVGSVFSALKAILQAPDESLLKGLNARKFVDRNFLWSKVAERYMMQVKAIIRGEKP